MRRLQKSVAPSVVSQVLSVIRPTDAERQAEAALSSSLVAHIRSHAPECCDVVLTGSMAKNTYLRDKKDIDIFVLFDRSVKKDVFEAQVKGIMARAFPQLKYQLSYAEHPYVRFRFEGRRVDLVPAYKITDAAERLSAVDRSVLHTDFVRKRLPASALDQVLLLKAFLQANSLYGAEIKVKGFSGYLCELLIIEYGSFDALVHAAVKWANHKSSTKQDNKPVNKRTGNLTSPPVFIDPKPHYNNSTGRNKANNRSSKMLGKKLGKPAPAMAAAVARFCGQVPTTVNCPALIVIDPTDKDRNVAAALSRENFISFANLCKDYLKKPATDFFLKLPETFDERLEKLSKSVRKQRGFLYLLSMPRPDIVDDVLWGQVYRMLGQFESFLEPFGPKAILVDDSRHLVRVAIALRKNALPPDALVCGPPINMKQHVQAFKKSHPGAKFIVKGMSKGKQGGRHIWAKVKRNITHADAAILSFFKHFASTRSHLACSEELLVLQRL